MNENFTNSDDNFENKDIISNNRLNDLLKTNMSLNDTDAYEDYDAYENYALNDDYKVSQDNEEKEPYEKVKEKKYVITVNQDNIAYFENLIPEKRTELINTLIASYRNKNIVISKNLATKKFLKHLFVVIITLIIGFPLVFYITNASIEATANSYREIQSNFEKLYQQQGGVKRKELNKMQNLKY